jgi:small subunit ribosomal protein S6
MTKPRQHLYEGMYILSSTLSDDARQKALDRITSAMTQLGGEIQKVIEQGRKKLAYEIEGKKEGYFYLIYFTSPASAISEVWKEYHLNEDLLRFMTVRVNEVPESVEFKPLLNE